ncbi:MAG: hypothetical protein M3495_09185 [Pseudomonadota bacterium]|nr:hypothetical protein [Pseudomonadota bacterium]
MKTSFSSEEHGGFITTDEPVKTDLKTADAAVFASVSGRAQRIGSSASGAPLRRLLATPQGDTPPFGRIYLTAPTG